MNDLTLETLNQLYDAAGVTVVIENGAITSAHIE